MAELPPDAGSASAAARDRLVLALDVDDLVEANRLARELRPWFGIVKVGLELFIAAGPEAVQEMIDDGSRVLLDLKLADIPATVNRAAQVVGSLGVSYLTMHAFPGREMLRAGVDGLLSGASRAGVAAPVALAVPVLPGEPEGSSPVFGSRVADAADAGCQGLLCAAGDVRQARQLAPGLLTVVTGLRISGAGPDDVPPRDAALAGADLLVIGRSVTAAPDREAAAAAVVDSLRDRRG